MQGILIAATWARYPGILNRRLFAPDAFDSGDSLSPYSLGSSLSVPVMPFYQMLCITAHYNEYVSQRIQCFVSRAC